MVEKKNTKRSKDVQTDKSEKPVCSHFLKGKCTRGEGCRFSHDASQLSNQDKEELPQKLKRKRPGSQWRSRQAEKVKDNTANVVPIDVKKDPPPLCKGHKEPCVRRRVLKDGPNKNREYFLCNRSGRAGRARCGYFQWCDKQPKAKASKSKTAKKTEFKKQKI
mmetsp:Transcript_13712/g.17885  ORF Transcript_13712/g.17885 Transcript_13712/m.17885 type:complete len:163 (+) Transcript_13712:275-763(+)|eukprot:CAMPEP_0184017478 /NCGR_PEP_ID=MMETSP0954-20121128/7557_1 /TAXON_ID=627963 /ORGANISM="Aplanochytrium sp, Strain PBS07" /LENGTH=162 /DNA_ID=CAMNT_0026298715 /DNA_START=261 /DNA_END=749 /DNA_ORIENTATION=+